MVEDWNDNSPVFAGGDAFEARVVENAAPEVEVTRVHAEDADSGDRGRVTYSIVQQTPPGKSGEVFALRVKGEEIELSNELGEKKEKKENRKKERKKVFFFLSKFFFFFLLSKYMNEW